MALTTSDLRASLTNLYQGALVEAFDAEMDRVIDNILDVNTTIGAREIVLTVKIKPSAKNRAKCAVVASAKSKLCPNDSLGFDIMIGKSPRDGHVEAREINSNATLPFPEPDRGENVKDLRQPAGKGV